MDTTQSATPESCPSPAADTVSPASETPNAPQTECLIHVRFAPDGAVREIGERPKNVPAQDWFNYLCRHTRNGYQALSGGRGLFRLRRGEVDRLRAVCSEEYPS
jgi:hypothetical protein